ncbi:MAG: hypothetical protein ACE367_16980 [Acidimicrobiales bacterium]
MRYLLDANLSPAIADDLGHNGFDALRLLCAEHERPIHRQPSTMS